ncbi:helix-turn-helix transcriptional regulator [Flavobacterium enshiense]|uniref:helix-turn-helix domain-containing protein n=1 Tax=Flavobacterium enshiense TaxID=1341165 RepID=UPI00345D2B50
MKKRETLTKKLGLTQIEIASLLGVTRTQWSMYEIGKRNLPLDAKKTIAALLQQHKNSKKTEKAKPLLSYDEVQKNIDYLKNELTNTKHQLIVVEKKITNLENKYRAYTNAMETLSFLGTNKNDSQFHTACIELRLKKSLKRNPPYRLEQLQFKKECLEMLKLKIEEQLKK